MSDRSRPIFAVRIYSGRSCWEISVKARNKIQAAAAALGHVDPDKRITNIEVDGETIVLERVHSGTTDFWLRPPVKLVQRIRALIPERFRSDFAAKYLEEALDSLRGKEFIVEGHKVKFLMDRQRVYSAFLDGLICRSIYDMDEVTAMAYVRDFIEQKNAQACHGTATYTQQTEAVQLVIGSKC